jgi:murein DD-endopeptidase MepM/ murein hydrolase activator NlpD
MKKGLLILFPIIAFATYMSRPAEAPATALIKTPPIEAPAPVEEVTPSEAVAITVTPATILQGDPVLLEITGLTSTSTIRALTFHNAPLAPFERNGKVEALIGLDLRLPPATYPATLTLTNGRVIKQNIVVKERKMPPAPLGIPESLGGNTTSSQEELVTSLVDEAKIINAIESVEGKLWQGPFAWPLAGPMTVTDPYGYQRQTVGASIAHKGTDFRAATGTPVMAINDGIVRYTGYLRDYGNVIAIDHGTTILSIYMHLSKIGVVAGEEVKKGQVIAASGDTGYVLGPHLHLTIRIGGISIDPMKFYALLGEK